MKITCPHCGVVGSAHGSMPGEKVRCPQCDKVFKVMVQKIACPHCGVIGSAADSMVGMKLRCPRCEKVFLLTQDRLIGLPVSAIEIAGEVGIAVEEGGGIVSPAGVEEIFLEPVAEMELETVPEPEPEPEEEVVPEPEPEPEEEVVPEPEPEPEEEVVPEPEAEPEVEVVPEPEAEPEEEVVPEPEPEPEEEVVPEPEAEPEPEIVHEDEPVLPVEETKDKGEGPESTAMPTRVCDGCGESFHPEFMQEVDSKFYCGVCQLRSAALDAKEKAPRFGGGQLRGALAALLLLGLLVLLLLVLKKLGII
ncbi:MAG: hypothetical protein PHZ02_14395 [Desulfocapsaceae bacterium]|nr:hypothetical protein [Desulfocapsaceae bacterium]